jgi:UDP-glucose 4-epimerase
VAEEAILRITVLGGGGFIGSAIVDALLKEGHSLTIFERPRIQRYRQFTTVENVRWLEGDILSVNDLVNAVRSSEVVVHLVSTTLPKNSSEDPLYDAQSNIVASLQLLEAMVQCKCKRIVFISSGGTVYGNPVYLPIDEKHPTEPTVSYGVTKLAIEKYINVYSRGHGIKPIILRVANPFGERQRIETAQGVIGAFVYRAIRDQQIEVWGDGSVTRDFIYVGDVADAFVKAIHYAGDGSVFNISSGTGLSLVELIAVIEELLRKPVKRIYRAARSFDVPVSVLSNDFARRELKWEPVVGLREGLIRTVDWMRSQLCRYAIFEEFT